MSCIVYLLVSGPILASGYAGIFIESLGVFLGLLAIFIMKIGNFNITSRLKVNGKLVTSGPYSFIRHPMYLAQLLALLPLVVDFFSWWRLGAFVLLSIVLLMKIRYEEASLRLRFAEYTAYMMRTKRLLPFIY